MMLIKRYIRVGVGIYRHHSYIFKTQYFYGVIGYLSVVSCDLLVRVPGSDRWNSTICAADATAGWAVAIRGGFARQPS